MQDFRLCTDDVSKMQHTDKDDVVLDPMCGSGTTASACDALGRKCLLNDINNEVIEIVQSRFQ